MITGLGSDYIAASSWLLALSNIPYLYAEFKKRWTNHVETYGTVLHDTRDLVSTILTYNMIQNKYQGASAADRRQSLKDSKKKLRVKFGKDYDMPLAMNDRAQAAITQK